MGMRLKSCDVTHFGVIVTIVNIKTSCLYTRVCKYCDVLNEPA